jgi:hypothetical protein
LFGAARAAAMVMLQGAVVRPPVSAFASPSAASDSALCSQSAYAKKHFDSGSAKPLWHLMQGVFVLAFGLEARRALLALG